LSQLAAEVLRKAPSIEDLLALLTDLSGRAQDELRAELSEHLATRVAFLLLGDVLDAGNYSIVQDRLARRFGAARGDVTALADELAHTMARIDAAGISRKSGLRDLPYPIRRRLFATQNNRCGICGWCFADDVPSWRCEAECQATLDHRVPFGFGGERLENLWVLCSLCNTIKAARTHIGENGRVWINNHIYYEAKRPVAFWTMRRDKKCVDCSMGPGATRLQVQRRNQLGAWVVDNCRTVCPAHSSGGSVLDY
jgi:hypothetical protein